MKLWQLVRSVRSNIKDEDGLTFHDEQITEQLNAAQLDLTLLSRRLSTWSTSVEANTLTITKPTDCLIPKYCYFDYSSSRYRLSIKYGFPPETSSVTGYPEDVYIVGTDYYLYPVPSSGGTLLTVGVAKPNDMVDMDNDVPSVENADSALIAYATWMLLLASDNPEKSKGYQKIYEQKKQEWSIADSLANPMPTVIERAFPW